MFTSKATTKINCLRLKILLLVIVIYQMSTGKHPVITMLHAKVRWSKSTLTGIH